MRCPCCPFTPGKLQQSCFSRSVVILAGLGCSCLPPQALYLAWVLSCSGAVLAGGFPSADLFLNSLHLCREGFSSCAPQSVSLPCHSGVHRQHSCATGLSEGRDKVPTPGFNDNLISASLPARLSPAPSKPRHPNWNPSPQQSLCCSSCRVMPSPALPGTLHSSRLTKKSGLEGQARI